MSTPEVTPSSFPPVNFMENLADSHYKNLLIGIFAGTLEVVVDQPLVSWKNILQKRNVAHFTAQSQPSLWKSVSLKQLYAGSTANVVGSGFITGAQMWAFGFAQVRLAGERDIESLSPKENLMAACVGGIAAAPFSSWTEMLMDKYRENVKSYEERGKKEAKPTYAKATQDLWKRYGWRVVHVGMVPTIYREIGFTASYAAGAPFLSVYLQRNETFHFIASKQSVVPVDLIATIGGGIFAGMIGATLTHPFDTWKTRCQGGLPTEFWPQGIRVIICNHIKMGHQTRHWRRAVTQLSHDLLSTPFQGLGPRFGRVVTATTLFSLVNWTVNKKLSKSIQQSG